MTLLALLVAAVLACVVIMAMQTALGRAAGMTWQQVGAKWLREFRSAFSDLWNGHWRGYFSRSADDDERPR